MLIIARRTRPEMDDFGGVFDCMKEVWKLKT